MSMMQWRAPSSPEAPPYHPQAQPDCHEAQPDAELAAFVGRHSRLFVLTGAGASVASGIPAYRDENGAWMRRQPISQQDFVASAAERRRYWARSMAGYPLLCRAAPNAAHIALAALEGAGRVAQVVTQNVDGLHQHAGSQRVLELHGNVHWVICLCCHARYPRAEVQGLLHAGNGLLPAQLMAPDGDADLSDEAMESSWLRHFQPPSCRQCGGMLKPDVVFFGDAVPRPRVAAAMAALHAADAILVVGSSLMAWSAYRFCRAAADAGKPIAAINLGRSRADPLLQLAVRRNCGEALMSLVQSLDKIACRKQPSP